MSVISALVMLALVNPLAGISTETVSSCTVSSCLLTHPIPPPQLLSLDWTPELPIRGSLFLGNTSESELEEDSDDSKSLHASPRIPPGCSSLGACGHHFLAVRQRGASAASLRTPVLRC